MNGRVAALLVALATATTASADALPPGPGRSLVYGTCRTCHSLQYLTDSAGIDRAQWASVLKSMHQLGMPELAPENREKILDYLATYLGPNPPPATAQGAAGASAQTASGESVFKQQCATCHQADAKGVAHQFPPLAGNEDLFASHLFPVLVVLNGLQGPIQVHSQSFDAQMPAFGYLSDAEIAAVVNHVRQAWGNAKLKPASAPVTVKEVEQARGRALSAQDVHAYRAQRGLE